MGSVKRFRYLGDRLFLVSSGLYALNRWAIKPHVHNAFMRFHFNDCLLMPCALPPLLLMQRWLGSRKHDEMPTFTEITVYFVFWSILFEVVGPHIFRHSTGDVWDVVAYAGGAIVAALWWHRDRLSRSLPVHEL